MYAYLGNTGEGTLAERVEYSEIVDAHDCLEDKGPDVFNKGEKAACECGATGYSWLWFMFITTI